MPLRQDGRLVSVAYLLVFVASVLLNNPIGLLAFPGFTDLQRVFPATVFRRVEHRRVFGLFGGFYRLDRLNNLLRAKR